MKKRNQSKKPKSPLHEMNDMLKDFNSKETDLLNENKADNLLKELAEAFKSNDRTRFDEIATELSTKGISVHINSNHTFTVSFPYSI